MKLRKLTIENFKGIKRMSFDFEGNVTITAQNYQGKTTIYDAFIWCLFGKNSLGESEFDIHPLDDNNQTIKGVNTIVEIVLELNSGAVLLHRELKERNIKGQLKGWETYCEIDGVPKKVSEFNSYIQALIPEKRFKLLTDVQHFNRLPWMNRRQYLMELAGELKEPKGFADVIQTMSNRTADEYQKFLDSQKKKYKQERDEINPRIDELRKAMPELKDTTALEKRRAECKTEIDKLNIQLEQLLSQEAIRQNKLDDIAELKSQMKQREIELANNTTGQKALIGKKQDLDSSLYNEQATMVMYFRDVQRQREVLQTLKDDLENASADLLSARTLYQEAKKNKVVDVCSACGQKLPEDKLNKAVESNKDYVKAKQNVVDTLKKKIQLIKKDIATQEEVLARAKADYDEVKIQYDILKKDTESKIKDIDGRLKERPKVAPESDGIWCDLSSELKRAETEVGPPVAQQLEQLTKDKQVLVDEMGELLLVLAQRDRMERDKNRIRELERKEKELSQLIADCDLKLDRLGEYRAAKCRMVEISVNKKFKYAQFKLFDQRLNENIIECCDTLYHGVPWGNLSYGESVRIGLDIINTFSKHYKESAPIFIDGAEGITFDLETDTQVIQLIAKKGVKKLTINQGE